MEGKLIKHEFGGKRPGGLSTNIFQRLIEGIDGYPEAKIIQFPDRLVDPEEDRQSKVNTAAMTIIATNELDRENAGIPLDERSEASQLKHQELWKSRIGAVSELTQDELLKAFRQVKEIEQDISNQSETAKEGE